MLKKNKKRICINCGSWCNNSSISAPGIIFNFLEGKPFICEKCIFKILMNGSDIEWDKEIIKYIELEG
jgi:hypothetical protein